MSPSIILTFILLYLLGLGGIFALVYRHRSTDKADNTKTPIPAPPTTQHNTPPPPRDSLETVADQIGTMLFLLMGNALALLPIYYLLTSHPQTNTTSSHIGIALLYLVANSIILWRMYRTRTPAARAEPVYQSKLTTTFAILALLFIFALLAYTAVIVLNHLTH